MSELINVDFKSKTVTSRTNLNAQAPESDSKRILAEQLRLREDSLKHAEDSLREALDANFDITQAVIAIPHSESESGTAIIGMMGRDDRDMIKVLESAIAGLKRAESDA